MRVYEIMGMFKRTPPVVPLKSYRFVRNQNGRYHVSVGDVPYIIVSVADAITRHSDRYTDAFKVVNRQGESLGDFATFEKAVDWLRRQP